MEFSLFGSFYTKAEDALLRFKSTYSTIKNGIY